MRPTITKLFFVRFSLVSAVILTRKHFTCDCITTVKTRSTLQLDDLPNDVARAGKILHWSASDRDQNQYLDFHDTYNVFGSHPRTNVNCCQAIHGHIYV